MIDTDYKYAQWSTNVNTMGMNWQTYHQGLWYNPAEKTYDQALDEIKETIRLQVLKDHPHLIAYSKDDSEKKVNITKHSDTVFSWENPDVVIPNNSTHVVSKPQFYEEKPTETATDGTPYIPKIGTTERTIHDIQQCKTVTQLKDDYAFMASMNKKLKVAYDEKMASFTIGNKVLLHEK